MSWPMLSIPPPCILSSPSAARSLELGPGKTCRAQKWKYKPQAVSKEREGKGRYLADDALGTDE